MLLGAACTDAPTDTGEPSPFGVLADGVAGGALLGVHSDGGEALFVGGDLAGGPASIVRYDGTAACVEEEAASRALWWIHGTRDGEWWAVGEAGTVMWEHDGVRTTEDVATVATLFGVWATDSRVWAVGGDVWGTGLGEIWVREGGEWSRVAEELPGVLFKVWDGWFVGEGVAYHLEDGALVDRTPEGAPRLVTVRGRAEDDVWAVGGADSPLLLHWDGAAWSEVKVSPACTSQPLNGVWTAPGEDVWIAGPFGAMAGWDGAAWTCESPAVTGEHFHAVWKHGDEVLWAGGNLYSHGDNYGTIGRFGEPAGAVEVGACGS